MVAAQILCDIAATCARLARSKRAWEEEGDTEDDAEDAKASENWGSGFGEIAPSKCSGGLQVVRVGGGEEEGGEGGEMGREEEKAGEEDGAKGGEVGGEEEKAGEAGGKEKEKEKGKGPVYPTPEWTGSEVGRLERERRAEQKQRAENERVVEKERVVKKVEEVEMELVTKSGRRSKRPKRWGE